MVLDALARDHVRHGGAPGPIFGARRVDFWSPRAEIATEPRQKEEFKASRQALFHDGRNLGRNDCRTCTRREAEGIRISGELGFGQPKFAAELGQEEKPQA